MAASFTVLALRRPAIFNRFDLDVDFCGTLLTSDGSPSIRFTAKFADQAAVGLMQLVGYAAPIAVFRPGRLNIDFVAGDSQFKLDTIGRICRRLDIEIHRAAAIRVYVIGAAHILPLTEENRCAGESAMTVEMKLAASDPRTATELDIGSDSY